MELHRAGQKKTDSSLRKNLRIMRKSFGQINIWDQSSILGFRYCTALWSQCVPPPFYSNLATLQTANQHESQLSQKSEHLMIDGLSPSLTALRPSATRRIKSYMVQDRGRGWVCPPCQPPRMQLWFSINLKRRIAPPLPDLHSCPLASTASHQRCLQSVPGLSQGTVTWYYPVVGPAITCFQSKSVRLCLHRSLTDSFPVRPQSCHGLSLVPVLIWSSASCLVFYPYLPVFCFFHLCLINLMCFPSCLVLPRNRQSRRTTVTVPCASCSSLPLAESTR